MRALILAAALLVTGTAHAQYNDPSQASPATSPPVDQTSPTASDANSMTPAADASAPATTDTTAAAPTTPQLADTVSLPKCSRKVTDRCAERR